MHIRNPQTLGYCLPDPREQFLTLKPGRGQQALKTSFLTPEPPLQSKIFFWKPASAGAGRDSARAGGTNPTSSPPCAAWGLGSISTCFDQVCRGRLSLLIKTSCCQQSSPPLSWNRNLQNSQKNFYWFPSVWDPKPWKGNPLSWSIACHFKDPSDLPSYTFYS